MPTIDDLVLILIMLVFTAIMLWHMLQQVDVVYKNNRRISNALALANIDMETARTTVRKQSLKLELHEKYFVTTNAITNESAALADQPNRMMDSIVELVSDTFNFYLVSIFLVDDTGEWVEIKAASSQTGKSLVDRNYRLRIGSGWAGEGIVGQVAATGKIHVVRDVSSDDIYVETSELQDTISEIAFPLSTKGIVTGVFDIQSNRIETFDGFEIQLLKGLVNYVSLAIENANHAAQLNSLNNNLRHTLTGLSVQSWAASEVSGDKSAISDVFGTGLRNTEWQPEMVKAMHTGKVIPNHQRSKVSIPIKSRGQVIGVIDAQIPDTAGEWTEEQLSILQIITEQLGNAIESAQLYNDTQQRAARETLSREIVDKMRNTVSFEELLRTTIVEISQVMGTPRAFVQWLPSVSHMEEQLLDM
jgi:GAF domain-containing protein